MPNPTRAYEAMFVVDPAVAEKEWQRVSDDLENLLKRHHCEQVSIKRWGDRKLAYPVKGQIRATYVLTHFQARPQSLPPLHADLNLAEFVLRYQIFAREEGEPTTDEKGEADASRERQEARRSRREPGGNR